jgi:hypothetical protein
MLMQSRIALYVVPLRLLYVRVDACEARVVLPRESHTLYATYCCRDVDDLQKQHDPYEYGTDAFGRSVFRRLNVAHGRY